MTVRLYLSGERIGSQLATSGKLHTKKILDAERGAAEDVVKLVTTRARADIKQAGKFGPRWTDGFRGKITEGGGFIRVAFTEAVPYWRIFQTGGVIHGKPLLWIPLSFAKDAQGVRARDYPGRLFRVDRRVGAPLLLASGSGKAEPKYFGKTSVTIPKKFHLIEIVRQGAKQLKEFYAKRIKT